jgi:hypothetical protein
MSDEGFDSEDDALTAVYLTGKVESTDLPSLRWTPTCLLIDILDAVATIVGGFADFFENQSRSFAARASLKEELRDRRLKLRLHEDARRRVKRHMTEDLDAMPETPAGEH